jgi:hypothetical protein
MKHEEQHEVDLSRRTFLKFGGLLGLTLGALRAYLKTPARFSTM